LPFARAHAASALAKSLELVGNRSQVALLFCGVGDVNSWFIRRRTTVV